MKEVVPQVENEMAQKRLLFFRQLKNLPAEIAKRWEAEFDDLLEETPDFFNRFQAFVDARNQALDSTLEIESSTSQEVREEIREVQRVIRNTFGDSHHFLGNGYTAEVYELPIAPHLCVKYIKDQNAYNENNHMRVEFDFLVKLRSFIAEGVRTPLPYFIRIHPSEGHSYGMERIAGKSLSQIIERPGDNKELIGHIKTLDRKEVERCLVAYVETMHTQFNITHGDLYMRNMMIDESGHFYIIDFGKARLEEIGEDHEARRKVDIATITSEIRNFFNKIDNIDIS